MNLPEGKSRTITLVAAAIWAGALTGPWVPWLLGFGVVAACLAMGWRWRALLVVAAVGLGAVSGSLAAARSEATMTAELPSGSGVVAGVAMTDAVPYGSSSRFLVRPEVWTRAGVVTQWRGPALAVVAEMADVTAGDRVEVEGLIRAGGDTIRGDPVAGTINARKLTLHEGGSSPWLDAGNAVRNRVRTELAVLGDSSEAGLLAGFLIGDTTGLARGDTEALRLAGLTHYVAVSGSNVALVLGAWWLILAPIGASSRIKAVSGIIVLIVFVIATRWESSVIRAATMATLVMGGRAAGIVLDGWAALAGAVAILLTVSGDLAYDIGFQLSVLATGGVLATLSLWRNRSPRWLWTVVAATLGAQAAVVPLLLLHFGTVPLLSPLANVIAAPLVTAATALAGAGVLTGWDAPLRFAEPIAGAVLAVARTAAGWPQLGVLAAAGLLGLLLLVWPTELRRPTIIALTVVAVVGVVPPGPPSVPTVVFLDVGQGDAVLLRDPSGSTALIDGGRDPTILRSALRRYGIRHIDLLVTSHGDADHVGGLLGLSEHHAIGALWYPDHADESDLLSAVVVEASAAGAATDRVRQGRQAQLGEFSLHVLGPARRYAADNDGSIVLLVTVGSRQVLLPGDVGAVAQQSLPAVRPDLLLVPHHGAATTDPDWLRETVGPIAVISVGPNSYGHPDEGVLAALTEAGARVLTTWEQGDIAIQLR